MPEVTMLTGVRTIIEQSQAGGTAAYQALPQVFYIDLFIC